jgi:hypothetical protein
VQRFSPLSLSHALCARLHAPLTCGALIVASLVSSTASAQIAVEPGFDARRYNVAPAGTVPGGFALAPNGNLVLYDGSAIVERDRQGGFVRTVYSAAPTFGSFLRFAPDGSSLYFGESGAGNVYRLAWPSGSAAVAANVDFNYDAAFDAQGVAFVSANPGFAGQVIYRLDPQTGTPDRIAALPGASGPIVFGAGGELYAMIVPGVFPPPAGAYSLVRFDAAQVASAIGSGELGAAQATVVHGGLDGGSSLALDGEGRLLLTTGTELLALEIGGGSERLASAGSSDYLGAFAFERGTTPFCRAYGAASGGTVVLTTTDFATTYDVLELAPARPLLAASAPNPLPPGSLVLTLSGAAPHAPVLLLVAAQPAQPELAVLLSRPFLLGIDPAALLLVLPLATTGQGDLALPLIAPSGASGFASTWQAVLFEPQGPYASSAALELVMQ